MRRELLSLLLFVAPMATFAGSDNCTLASYAQTSAPIYPAQAVTEKIEGTIVVAAVVETDGTPGQVEVRKSSGNAELDQAAVETVAKWRFNPKRCNGKVARSLVMVPIEFSLGDHTPESGGNISSQIGVSGRTVRVERDPQPVEFSSVKEGLRALRANPEIEEHRTARGALYLSKRDTIVWQLIELYDGPSPAGPKRLIIRERWLETSDSSKMMIAALCESTPAWCQGELTSRMAYMQQHPPPPPPPPPPQD